MGRCLDSTASLNPRWVSSGRRRRRFNIALILQKGIFLEVNIALPPSIRGSTGHPVLLLCWRHRQSGCQNASHGGKLSSMRRQGEEQNAKLQACAGGHWTCGTNGRNIPQLVEFLGKATKRPRLGFLAVCQRSIIGPVWDLVASQKCK